MTTEEKIARILFMQKHLAGEKHSKKRLVSKAFLVDSILARMEIEFQRHGEFVKQCLAKQAGESLVSPPIEEVPKKGAGGGRRVIRKPGGL